MEFKGNTIKTFCLIFCRLKELEEQYRKEKEQTDLLFEKQKMVSYQNIPDITIYIYFFFIIDSASLQGTLGIAVLPWPAQQRFPLLT